MKGREFYCVILKKNYHRKVRHSPYSIEKETERYRGIPWLSKDSKRNKLTKNII